MILNLQNTICGPVKCVPFRIFLHFINFLRHFRSRCSVKSIFSNKHQSGPFRKSHDIFTVFTGAGPPQDRPEQNRNNTKASERHTEHKKSEPCPI